MDDLFEGYMVLDGIGDFLGDIVPANHPKAPDIVLHTEQHAGLSKQGMRPETDDLNELDQW
jgi:hypothetical protein